MGFNLYARWPNETSPATSKEGNFNLTAALYYWPSATKLFFAEAFAEDAYVVRIPAAVLKERLAKTMALVREREAYSAKRAEIERLCQLFQKFADLCERKEQETGEPVHIIADY